MASARGHLRAREGEQQPAHCPPPPPLAPWGEERPPRGGGHPRAGKLVRQKKGARKEAKSCLFGNRRRGGGGCGGRACVFPTIAATRAAPASRAAARPAGDSKAGPSSGQSAPYRGGGGASQRPKRGRGEQDRSGDWRRAVEVEGGQKGPRRGPGGGAQPPRRRAMCVCAMACMRGGPTSARREGFGGTEGARAEQQRRGARGEQRWGGGGREREASKGRRGGRREQGEGLRKRGAPTAVEVAGAGRGKEEAAALGGRAVRLFVRFFSPAAANGKKREKREGAKRGLGFVKRGRRRWA